MSSFTALVAADQSPKEEQIAKKIIAAWHIENSAIMVFQKTGAEVVNNARIVTLGRLDPSQQQAMLEEITLEVETYLGELAPFVSESALKLKSPILTPMLTKNFDEGELAQLLEIIESPVNKKFQKIQPQVQREYEQQVVEETGDRVKHELTELTKRVNDLIKTALLE
jgi:hypothetical protein